jgi:molybdopterin converting factor small subunit
MATIEIPVILQQHTHRQTTINFPQTQTIPLLELIQQCVHTYPALKSYLLTDHQLSNFVSFYVNGKDSRHLQGESTLIQEHDTISIIVAIAGG